VPKSTSNYLKECRKLTNVDSDAVVAEMAWAGMLDPDSDEIFGTWLSRMVNSLRHPIDYPKGLRMQVMASWGCGLCGFATRSDVGEKTVNDHIKNNHPGGGDEAPCAAERVTVGAV
jgi:hypothetical protein